MTKSPTGRVLEEPNLLHTNERSGNLADLNIDYAMLEYRSLDSSKISKELLYSKDLDFHEIFKSILLNKS